MEIKTKRQLLRSQQSCEFTEQSEGEIKFTPSQPCFSLAPIPRSFPCHSWCPDLFAKSSVFLGFSIVISGQPPVISTGADHPLLPSSSNLAFFLYTVDPQGSVPPTLRGI